MLNTWEFSDVWMNNLAMWKRWFSFSWWLPHWRQPQVSWGPRVRTRLLAFCLLPLLSISLILLFLLFFLIHEQHDDEQPLPSQRDIFFQYRRDFPEIWEWGCLVTLLFLCELKPLVFDRWKEISVLDSGSSMLPSSVLMQFCSLRCEIGQNHWLELEKKNFASSVVIIFYLHLSRSPSKTHFLSDSSVVNVFPSPAPSAVHVSLLSPFTLCLIWMCFDRLAPPCGRIACRRRRRGLFSLDPFAQASVGSQLPPPFCRRPTSLAELVLVSLRRLGSPSARSNRRSDSQRRCFSCWGAPPSLWPRAVFAALCCF